ncbi:MAG: lysylphosphatidylglycerol synthase transmembrane domain-containing protein, partial [Gemmatimonadaceae bacterium]
MNHQRARRFATWGVLLVLVALLVVAVRRLDVARVSAELRVVRGGWVALALCAYLALLPLWGAQWHLLAPRTARNTFRRMLGLVAMASSTHSTTAFFMGEATSAVLLSTQVGLAGSEVVSVIAMDQLLVGLAKLAVLLTAALTLTLPEWLTAGIVTLASGVTALLVVTVLGAWHADRILARVGGMLPPRGARALSGMGQALAPLRTPRRGGVALVLGLVKMVAEVAAIICIQRAFGVRLPAASAVLVLAATQMATLIPLVPANLGVYEGAIVLIYTRLGLPTELAVGMAVVQHAASFAA